MIARKAGVPVAAPATGPARKVFAAAVSVLLERFSGGDKPTDSLRYCGADNGLTLELAEVGS